MPTYREPARRPAGRFPADLRPWSSTTQINPCVWLRPRASRSGTSSATS